MTEPRLDEQTALELYMVLQQIADALTRIVTTPAALADWYSLDELRMTANAALARARGENP